MRGEARGPRRTKRAPQLRRTGATAGRESGSPLARPRCAENTTTADLQLYGHTAERGKERGREGRRGGGERG